MTTHSSVLAWRIPWTEKPGRLQSMGSHRVGHDWSDLTAAALHWASVVSQMVKNPPCQCRRPRFDPWVGKLPWRKEWQPTPVFLTGHFHGQRSFRAIVHRVPKCQTWLSNLTLSLLQHEFMNDTVNPTQVCTQERLKRVKGALQWQTPPICQKHDLY